MGRKIKMAEKFQKKTTCIIAGSTTLSFTSADVFPSYMATSSFASFFVPAITLVVIINQENTKVI